MSSVFSRRAGRPRDFLWAEGFPVSPSVVGMDTGVNANHLSGPTIRNCRRAAGLSQQALAQKAECSIGYVRVLERGYLPGKRSPTLSRIIRTLEGDRNE